MVVSRICPANIFLLNVPIIIIALCFVVIQMFMGSLQRINVLGAGPYVKEAPPGQGVSRTNTPVPHTAVPPTVPVSTVANTSHGGVDHLPPSQSRPYWPKQEVNSTDQLTSDKETVQKYNTTQPSSPTKHQADQKNRIPDGQFFPQGRTQESRNASVEVPGKYNISIITNSPGLGNQLFELASLMGIAVKNNMNIILPLGIEKMIDIFNLKHISKRPTVKGLDLNDPIGGKFHAVTKRGDREYDNMTETLFRKHQNIRLQGYYHSFKYFQHVEKLIRKEFTFKEAIVKKVTNFLNQVAPHNSSHPLTRVGIHIRRGDFLREDAQAFGDAVATPEYIAKAVQFFEDKFDNVQFIVCSNGMDWAKQYVNASQVVFSEGSSGVEDLALLAACDHMIVTSGTFSWWAGWLANGITVYYELYPTPGSPLWKGFRKEDFYPPQWIPMS